MFCTRIVPVVADAVFPMIRISTLAFEVAASVGVDTAVVESGAVAAKLSALVASSAVLGPVLLVVRSTEAPVTASLQPDGGVIVSVKNLSTVAVVGQLLALIEPVPVAGVSPGLRMIGPTVRPEVPAVPVVEACVPVWPVNANVASTPVYGVAQWPVFDPDPDPDPEPELPSLHSCAPDVLATHV